LGYWVATAILKDGREFKQVMVNSGFVTQAKGHSHIPFNEADIDRFVITHDKWDFSYS